MKSSRSTPALPSSVRRALEKLGADIRSARLRRRISMALMAERAFVSRNTVARVERGDPGVSIGIQASVLFVLGMSDRLADLVDPSTDEVGMRLDADRLPRRVRGATRGPRKPPRARRDGS
jgi:transcriptional regulator with XRE-family HTH domain